MARVVYFTNLIKRVSGSFYLQTYNEGRLTLETVLLDPRLSDLYKFTQYCTVNPLLSMIVIAVLHDIT